MNLVSEVIFKYKIEPVQLVRIAESGRFSTVEELQQAIQESRFNKPNKTLQVSVQRIVEIKDMDAPIARTDFPSINDCILGGKDKRETVRFKDSRWNTSFFVADKLMYPSDVRKLLQEQGHDPELLNHNQLRLNTPVIYWGIEENSKTGLIVKGRKTNQIFHRVSCRNLTNDDIVAHKDLRLEWPAGEYTRLISFLKAMLAQKEEVIGLAKTKEVVH